jgi:hypothetical protein
MSKSGFQLAKLQFEPEIEAHSEPVERNVPER